MNHKTTKCCVVDKCMSTSFGNPGKLFIYVSQQESIRKKWLELARRDPSSFSPTSVLYFCEDHFDLPSQMENYMEYRIMGKVCKVRMKPNCLPIKFDCFLDKKRLADSSTANPDFTIKMKKQGSEKDLKEAPGRYEPHSNLISHENKDIVCHKEKSNGLPSKTHEQVPSTAVKSVQVNAPNIKSKATQAQVKSRNKLTSTFKFNMHSVSTSPPLKICMNTVSTSPLKYKECNTHEPTPSILSSSKSQEIFISGEQSDNDILYTPKESSPSIISLETSECSEFEIENKRLESSKNFEFTLTKIVKNPFSYVGIPYECYYILDLIEKGTSISSPHILMCLRKIKSNASFRELGDDFSISPTCASKVFAKSIPIIASLMKPFIVELDKNLTKANLPMAFRQKYHYTSCIIDCLEIEVQKPSKAFDQTMTWSEYKKTNTIKYLISCTPNGLINFISPGYGGKISDTCIVQISQFVNCLQPGMSVMADRGFKHVEQYLRQHGVQLVRPPSVATGAKLTKSEARETKQIASLRIHVERLIRRLRVFEMLKPHACLNLNFVKILDDIIIIACGLINLQNSLIKH